MENSSNVANTTKAKVLSAGFNKYAYGAFVLLGIYFMIFSSDFMMGVGELGIALCFDPFDQTVTFSKRPKYQQVWLVLHVIVVITLMVFGFLR